MTVHYHEALPDCPRGHPQTVQPCDRDEDRPVLVCVVCGVVPFPDDGWLPAEVIAETRAAIRRVRQFTQDELRAIPNGREWWKEDVDTVNTGEVL